MDIFEVVIHRGPISSDGGERGALVMHLPAFGGSIYWVACARVVAALGAKAAQTALQKVRGWKSKRQASAK